MQHLVFAASGSTPGTNRVLWAGFNVAAGGSVAIVNIRDNSVSGPIVARIKVAANDSKTESFARLVDVNGPLYVEIVSGAPENVTIFWE
jgi:hypothetical protein